jgi:hypothetical protein
MTDTTRTALDLDAIRRRQREIQEWGVEVNEIAPYNDTVQLISHDVPALIDEVERLWPLAAAFEVIAAEERKGRWWRDPRNGPNHDHDNPPYWDSTGEVCARCEAWGRALDALDGQ